MEAIMRNGVLQTVMCLVGLQAPINCEVNWKNSKVLSFFNVCCPKSIRVLEFMIFINLDKAWQL